MLLSLPKSMCCAMSLYSCLQSTRVKIHNICDFNSHYYQIAIISIYNPLISYCIYIYDENYNIYFCYCIACVMR